MCLNNNSYYIPIGNVVHGKTMENLRNRIDVRLSSNKNRKPLTIITKSSILDVAAVLDPPLKWTSKPSYMSQKLFDNDLVAIPKSKVTLKLNKLVYTGICIHETRNELKPV